MLRRASQVANFARRIGDAATAGLRKASALAGSVQSAARGIDRALGGMASRALDAVPVARQVERVAHHGLNAIQSVNRAVQRHGGLNSYMDIS